MSVLPRYIVFLKCENVRASCGCYFGYLLAVNSSRRQSRTSLRENEGVIIEVVKNGLPPDCEFVWSRKRYELYRGHDGVSAVYFNGEYLTLNVRKVVASLTQHQRTPI